MLDFSNFFTNTVISLILCIGGKWVVRKGGVGGGSKWVVEVGGWVGSRNWIIPSNRTV